MVLQDGIRQPLRLLIRHLPYDITTEALSDVVRRSCDNSVMESIKEVYIICGYPPQNNRPRILSTAVLVVQPDVSITGYEAVIQAVTHIFDGRTVFPEMEATASAVELSPIYLSSFSKANGNTGPNRDLEVQFQHESIEEDEDYQRFCAMIKVGTEELKSNATPEKIQDLKPEEEAEEKQKQECSDKCAEKPVSVSLLVHELLVKIEKLEKSEKESKKMSVKDIRLRLLYQSQRERERDEKKNHIKPHGTEYKQETKCKLQKRSKERKLFDGVYSTRKSGADVKAEKVHRMSSQNIRKKRKEERRTKRSCDRVEKSVSACKGDGMGKRTDRRKKRGDKEKEGGITDVPRKQRRRREKDVSMKNEYNLEEKKRKHWENGVRQKTKPSKPNEFEEQQLHKKYQQSKKKNQQENRHVRRSLSGKGDKMDKNAESTKSIPGENAGKNIMLEKRYVDSCHEDGSLHASRPPKGVNLAVDTKECSSPLADKVRERQRRRERRDKKKFEQKAKNQPLVLRILTRPDENNSTPPNNV
ncbi:hypothetical protein LSM04_005214 [Trypanosoma melophagium]|uniref:uncharacterized protein n=1 Tax=Trypanosoma melophagium TaxID=715481 RepID=UPI00351A34FE|nr:hypothetical protein LSM04_005214 [Trypanosoma melophagium]